MPPPLRSQLWHCFASACPSSASLCRCSLFSSAHSPRMASSLDSQWETAWWLWWSVNYKNGLSLKRLVESSYPPKSSSSLPINIYKYIIYPATHDPVYCVLNFEYTEPPTPVPGLYSFHPYTTLSLLNGVGGRCSAPGKYLKINTLCVGGELWIFANLFT